MCIGWREEQEDTNQTKKAENKAANTQKIVSGQPSVETRWHESPKEQFMGAEVDRKVRWAGRIWLDLKEQ